MAESKYGRLFTEKDVLMLLRCAMVDVPKAERFDPDDPWTPEEVIGYATDEMDLTFPPDEPLFLLRGQDKAAANAIAISDDEDERLPQDYLFACWLVGCSEEHITAIREAHREMREWQAANPDRVKAAD